MKAERAETLLDRIRALPDDRVADLEAFLDELAACPPREITSRVAASPAESAFARVWDNPDDAVYDAQ